MDLSTVVLAFAPSLADHLYTAWRRRRGRIDHQARSLKELIARDYQNQLLQRKIERDVEALAEHIVESIEPIFDIDGATLTPGDLEVVITRLADVLKSAGVSPKFLLERRLDPLLVARAYREALPSARSDLSEKQASFFDACIEEIARRLIALADQLPGFGTDFVSELLRTQGLILDQGKLIIDAIVQFSEANRGKDAYLLNNFDIRFRHAVHHRFGEVQILGLDSDISSARLSLNTSYISLRVDASGRKGDAAALSEVASEDILGRSRRALIRGHAGSGKTTLLQWLAIQCVDKAFLPPIHVFNSHAPIMVRLRDYSDKPLPKGHELLSTTSSALIELDPGDWFRDHLHRGRFLFLIDGLDEVSEDKRSEIERWIEDLVLASPQSSYLITSRPSAIGQHYLRNLAFEEYFLKPMTPREVSLFIDYWHDAMQEAFVYDVDRKKAVANKRQQLHHLLGDNRSLVRLASTPLLSAVIRTLNLDGRLQLVSDRVDLYATASRLLYHDRDKKKNIVDPYYRSLTRKQKERLLSYIAYQFIKNGLRSATTSDIVAMISRSRSEEISEEAEQGARNVAEALLLRSGVLLEVSPNHVQFLHKTFQEYLGALEVVYRQDEMHVARDFDLKSWGELYLITLSIAPREVAGAMVAVVFERANSGERDWLAYLLLAGAGCREVHEVETRLKQEISASVSELIPPQDMSIVYQLAEMGSLVLPFLGWQDEFGGEEADRILTLLGLIEDDDAKPIIEDYASTAVVSGDTIECFARTLVYKNDDKLTQEVIGRLKRRGSSFFWKSSPKPRLYVGSRGLLRYSDFLPRVGRLILDGRGKLGVNEALATDWRAVDRVTRLSIVSAGNFQASKLERFRGLKEIDFAESFVEDAEFLSFLRRLKVFRLVESELADWGMLEYGELSKLYIAGRSVVDAVYHEIDVIMKGASEVFLDLDCIQGIERLEGAKFGHFDTWGIEVWRNDEVRALKEELGVR